MRRVSFSAVVAFAGIASLLSGAEQLRAHENHPFCESFSSLAGTIMVGRQHGKKMSELMAAADGLDEKLGAVVEVVIQDAFSRPRYSTEKYKQEAALDFENEWYATCLESDREK